MEPCHAAAIDPVYDKFPKHGIALLKIPGLTCCNTSCAETDECEGAKCNNGQRANDAGSHEACPYTLEYPILSHYFIHLLQELFCRIGLVYFLCGSTPLIYGPSAALSGAFRDLKLHSQSQPVVPHAAANNIQHIPYMGMVFKRPMVRSEELPFFSTIMTGSLSWSLFFGLGLNISWSETMSVNGW